MLLLIMYIIILILIIILMYYNNIYENFSSTDNIDTNKVDMNKYKIHHYDNDCILRCGDVSNCTRLKYQTDNYTKCKDCEKNSNNNFNKLITNYVCDEEEYKDYYFDNNQKCNYSDNLSCPNYNNISSPVMIKPYYIIPKDTSKYLSNTGLCQFCWNLN